MSKSRSRLMGETAVWAVTFLALALACAALAMLITENTELQAENRQLLLRQITE